MDFRRKLILRTSAAIACLIAVLQVVDERAEINVLAVDYVVYADASATSTTSHARFVSHMLADNAVKLGSLATIESRELRSCLS